MFMKIGGGGGGRGVIAISICLPIIHNSYPHEKNLTRLYGSLFGPVRRKYNIFASLKKKLFALLKKKVLRC